MIRVRVKGNRSICLSAGLNWTSLRSRDLFRRELFVDVADAWRTWPGVPPLSWLDTDDEKLVPLLGGEKGTVWDLSEAFEFVSEGVCLPSEPELTSLGSGGSCNCSGIASCEEIGGCCTLATMAGVSRSYCCIVNSGPVVNSVAVGP